MIHIRRPRWEVWAFSSSEARPLVPRLYGSRRYRVLSQRWLIAHSWAR